MNTTPLTDLLNLSNKTAVVTGGAKGIGEAIVRRLHEAGANVVIADMDQGAAHKLADSLSQDRADSAYVVDCDVSRSDDVNKTVATAIDNFGGIDILVNNAGIFPFANLAELSAELLDKIYTVNVRGVHLFTQAVAEHMRQTGRHGRMITVCSIDSLHPSGVGLAGYDASKHAVWGYLKNVALELASDNIVVNGIAPGGIATPGVAAMSGGNTEEVKASGSNVPLGRWGDPDDIAKTALFLASDLSTYMTGSMVVVDGGKLLQ